MPIDVVEQGCSRGTPSPEFSLAESNVHMIGIGGSGMSAAARMLADLGAHVTGSDREPFDGLGPLVAAGITVSIGHCAEWLGPDLDAVIASAAIPEDNIELQAARRRGIPVLKYAELLGVLMAHREGIAIAGTHGKSTTTAICAHIFLQAGLDPSFIVGARSPQLGGNGAAGSGPHFIVESCEFNRSFLHLRPRMAAVLNIEPDHLDCYTGLPAIVEAFSRFCEQVSPDGLVVCNAEDRWAVEASKAARALVLTFGFSEEADWRAYNLVGDRGRFSFDVSFHGEFALSARLSIPGRHNVSNALAAIALAYEGKVPPAVTVAALQSFEGISRRMSLRGEGHGIVIVDDYAHHPTEVRATITAARSRYTPKRTWVVFQPHQYSRTRHFLEDFAESFGEADEVIVPDIYNAREKDDGYGRLGAETLVSRICGHGKRACYVSLDAVADHLCGLLSEGDMVLTMGAGDVWKVADELVSRICPTN